MPDEISRVCEAERFAQIASLALNRCRFVSKSLAFSRSITAIHFMIVRGLNRIYRHELQLFYENIDFGIEVDLRLLPVRLVLDFYV